MNSFVPYCHTKAFSTYECFLFANSLTGITGFQPERRHFCCIKVQLGRLRFAVVVVVEYLGAALYQSPLTLLRRSCAQVSCLCLFNPLQVHTRFWACSRSRNQGFCACGVAARDGDDVIEIDMCHGRFKETSVQISIRSRLPLAKGVRITEAITGKRYTVGA